MSLRQIAAALGCGYGTIRERLQSGERKNPSKSGEENVLFTEVPAGL
jgi:DNA-directed RNA polymerase specialized sigma24 family protein